MPFPAPLICAKCGNSFPRSEFVKKLTLAQTLGYKRGKPGGGFHRMDAISKYCRGCRPRPKRTMMEKLDDMRWVTRAEELGVISAEGADAARRAHILKVQQRRARGQKKKKLAIHQLQWEPLLHRLDAERRRIRSQLFYRSRLVDEGKYLHTAARDALNEYLTLLDGLWARMKGWARLPDIKVDPDRPTWYTYIEPEVCHQIKERFKEIKKGELSAINMHVDGPHFYDDTKPPRKAPKVSRAEKLEEKNWKEIEAIEQALINSDPDSLSEPQRRMREMIIEQRKGE